MTNVKMQKLAEKLTAQYPWQKFSFGATPGENEWAWRYLTSCILVGGSLEVNTLEAAARIFEKYPTMQKLARAKLLDVADIIKSHGVRFHGPKAKYITQTAALLIERHKGVVPQNREKLEALPGVGRHVASVVLATCFNKNEFAVDVHVRRIAGRFGITGSDLEIENQVRAAVAPKLWGHFSRSFVDFGQTKCSMTPDCSGCKMKSLGCGETAVSNVVKVSRSAIKDFDNYNIAKTKDVDVVKFTFTKKGEPGSCIVRLSAQKYSCSCKGFRFTKKCKHVEMSKDL